MRDVYKELKELDYFAYIDTIQKADAIANSCFKQNISTKEGRDGAYEIEQSLVKMKLLELRTNNVVERSEQLKAEDKDLPFADYLEKWYELPRYEKVIMIENDTWYRCTVCGREGRVGRCCGDETRAPLNDLAKKEQAKNQKEAERMHECPERK